MTTSTTPPSNDESGAAATLNLAVIEGLYADFASGNMDGIIGALAADIVWNESANSLYAPNSPYEGIDAIVNGVFGPIPTEWEHFNVLPESYMASGDRVAMFGRYDAKYVATGRTMTPEVVHLWTLRDGKIVRYHQYMDTLNQQAAMRD